MILLDEIDATAPALGGSDGFGATIRAATLPRVPDRPHLADDLARRSEDARSIGLDIAASSLGPAYSFVAPKPASEAHRCNRDRPEERCSTIPAPRDAARSASRRST